MNSLSWMIYLAGVADGIRELFLMVAAIFFVVSAVIGLVAGAAEEPKFLRHLKKSIPCAALFALLCALTPSKDTVYAIAASEMGEEVLKTPEASKARQALNAWLDKQIGEQKAEKETP